MPTSDSRSCNLSTPEAGVGGFTLIEILVVLLVVTILVGITVPNIPAFVDKADYDLEARRLELLLNMARGEAVLDSTEYGFDLTDDGYEFLRYDEGSQQWRGQTAPFQARELPEGLTLDLRVADSAFSLLGEDLPRVLILSSGETTPVTMVLEDRGEYRRVLETDGYGPFSWRSDDER